MAGLTVMGRLFHIFGAAAQKVRAAFFVCVEIVSSILFLDRSDQAGRRPLMNFRRYCGC